MARFKLERKVERDIHLIVDYDTFIWLYRSMRRKGYKTMARYTRYILGKWRQMEELKGNG